MPAAEVEVSADLVRRLLASQHPDLARLPLEFLANGWDNELYRVGDELVARLPRRASARRSSRTSSAGCPCSPRGCPCHPVSGTDRGTRLRLPFIAYLPGVPAAQASSFDAALAAATPASGRPTGPAMRCGRGPKAGP